MTIANGANVPFFWHWVHLGCIAKRRYLVAGTGSAVIHRSKSYEFSYESIILLLQ